jgi:hypothetical protein
MGIPQIRTAQLFQVSQEVASTKVEISCKFTLFNSPRSLPIQVQEEEEILTHCDLTTLDLVQWLWQILTSRELRLKSQ